MFDSEAEQVLRLRPCCPYCQKEVSKAVALTIAYMLAAPLSPGLGPLMDVMDEQAEILAAIQERCCNGGN